MLRDGRKISIMVRSMSRKIIYLTDFLFAIGHKHKVVTKRYFIKNEYFSYNN